MQKFNIILTSLSSKQHLQFLFLFRPSSYIIELFPTLGGSSIIPGKEEFITLAASSKANLTSSARGGQALVQ